MIPLCHAYRRATPPKLGGELYTPAATAECGLHLVRNTEHNDPTFNTYLLDKYCKYSLFYTILTHL
jgi:hypothetical protein